MQVAVPSHSFLSGRLMVFLNGNLYSKNSIGQRMSAMQHNFGVEVYARYCGEIRGARMLEDGGEMYIKRDVPEWRLLLQDIWRDPLGQQRLSGHRRVLDPP